MLSMPTKLQWPPMGSVDELAEHCGRWRIRRAGRDVSLCSLGSESAHLPGPALLIPVRRWWFRRCWRCSQDQLDGLDAERPEAVELVQRPQRRRRCRR